MTHAKALRLIQEAILIANRVTEEWGKPYGKLANAVIELDSWQAQAYKLLTPPDRSMVIRDAEGHIIQRSRNLAGIRRYVSAHSIKALALDRLSDSAAHPAGKLCILFSDGSSFETNFASFQVLQNFVRNWRNVYGAPLLIDTVASGKVSYQNPALSN